MPGTGCLERNEPMVSGKAVSGEREFAESIEEHPSTTQASIHRLPLTAYRLPLFRSLNHEAKMPTKDPTQPERLKSQRAYTGRFINVDVETIRNPAGEELELEIIRHPGAAAVVPLLSDATSPDPQVLLIRQYRYAADGIIWEIPAGVLEPGEEPLDCARRELTEETGATADRMEHLASIYTTPGFTDEMIHLFLATGIQVSEPDHEPDEYIEVAPRPISAVLEMIKAGEIVDGKSIAALLYVAGFSLNL